MQAGYDYDYDPSGQARSHGLRRLSRLIWRATQLGALATVGFAVLFARTAPAATGSSHPPAPKAATKPSASPTPSPSPSPAPRRHRHHKPVQLLARRRVGPGRRAQAGLPQRPPVQPSPTSSLMYRTHIR
jgi:hypothetical protein